MEKNKKIFILFFVATFFVSSLMGGLMGAGTAIFVLQNESSSSGIMEKIRNQGNFDLMSNQVVEDLGSQIVVEKELAVISAVEKANPAVVSIVATKELPVIEKYYEDYGENEDLFRRFFGEGFNDFFRTPQYRQKGTETQEVGGGSGFVVSEDGYVITNKHVVFDTKADYTIIFKDESKYSAEVLARDLFNDIAVLKINQSGNEDFPFLELGDSADLKVGQSVIAIGNSLGEFTNTVSTGIISGLARNVTAGGQGVVSEELVDVIQTDASINPGNSGGPLLNLSGKVIGINTAIARNAENIGFALPVNAVKEIYESVKEHGKIVRPWLGVRYVILNEETAKANDLVYDYGALIIRGQERTDLAVIPGSPADRAGLVENDIILEIDGQRIDEKNPLARIIGSYKPGEEVELKVFSKEKEKNVKVKLTEMSDI